MRSISMLVTLALLPATAASAGEFDTSAPPLADLLAGARQTHKPVLLDFSTVW